MSRIYKCDYCHEVITQADSPAAQGVKSIWLPEPFTRDLHATCVIPFFTEYLSGYPQ